MATSTLAPEPTVEQPKRRLRWWREVLYIAGFYAAYSVIRDLRGTRPVSITQAYTNAKRVIGVERFFGIFQERRIQSWFLHSHLIVRALDDFYGSAHFIITFGVLIYAFRRQKERYPFYRNVLAITTALALLGFAFFPLMPPRLLPASYHITDTLRTIGGLWSFDSGPMSTVSNQYAAMPSLHFAWAMWCSAVIAGSTRRRALQVAVWIYPALTLLCILVTGNHYVLDAVGGAVTFGLAYGAVRLIRTTPAGRAAM